MKLIPVLGTLVLLGAIVQIVLGFQLAADVDAVRGIHVLLGIAGLILVIGLGVVAFRSKAATIYSKATISVLLVVVIAQLGLGSQLLGGTDSLAVVHEANGFLVLLLSLLMGGITFSSAKRRLS
jgi:hypothetical protein